MSKKTRKTVSAAVRDVATVYLRVSTTRQEEEGTSLETQEARCLAWCAENGIEVAGINRDVYTGAELDRPGLNRALDDIRQGRAGILLVYDLDRLSRDQIHTAVIFHQVSELGARVELVKEKLDNTPMGQFIRGAMSFSAQLERAQIRERTMRGRRARAERGAIIPGAHPMYGYRFTADRRGLVVDPETAPVVRRIFELAASGVTLFGIARRLDADGVPTPSQYFKSAGLLGNKPVSASWKHSTVGLIAHTEAYAGRYVAFGRGWPGKQRGVEDQRVQLPETACPAIVTAELYEQAQERITRNRAESTRNNKLDINDQGLLVRGFIVCGYCGHPMILRSYRQNTMGRRPRYTCASRHHKTKEVCEYSYGLSVVQEDVDKDVWAKVQAFLATPEQLQKRLERFKEMARSKEGNVQERLDSVDDLIERHKAKRTRLYRLIENADEDDVGELEGRVKELGQQIQRLQAERNKIERSRPPQLLPVDDTILQMLRSVAEVSHRMPNSVKRATMRFLGIKVKVFKAEPGVGVRGRQKLRPAARWEVTFGWDGINDGDKVQVDAERATISITS